MTSAAELRAGVHGCHSRLDGTLSIDFEKNRTVFREGCRAHKEENYREPHNLENTIGSVNHQGTVASCPIAHDFRPGIFAPS